LQTSAASPAPGEQQNPGGDKNQSLQSLLSAGQDAMTIRNYAAAVDSFSKASQLSAKDDLAWSNLANAYVSLAGSATGGDRQEAMTRGLAAWQKAIELKPKDAGYHAEYGIALARNDQYEQADGELQMAAQLDPKQAGTYYYNLAMALQSMGQNEAAGEALQKAAAAGPSLATAQYEYGVFLMSKAVTSANGKVIPPEGAVQAFQKYLQLQPEGKFAGSAHTMLEISGAAGSGDRSERLAGVIADCELRTSLFEFKFTHAITHTRLEGSAQPDNLKTEAERLVQAVHQVRDFWNRDHTPAHLHSTVTAALDTAREFHRKIAEAHLGADVTREWDGVRQEFDLLAQSFELPPVQW
jgi:Tfp pilus assembly protein PilF